MIKDRIDVNIAGGLDVPLPRMVHVRQRFELSKISSVTETVAQGFAKPSIQSKVKPGMSVALGVGSRGVNNIAECVKAVVGEIKALGGKPFVFPAMGSHGGATAEGQKEVLDGYGVTEAFIGCPVHSSMEVVEIGMADDGMPVFMDKMAAEADAIALVCRVKPHTNFRAPIESGIVKMLTIGMGKIIGASTLHTYGMDMFGVLLPKVAKIIMDKKNFLFGVAMVENAADETALIEVVPSEEVLGREPSLLARAKELMPKLQFEEIDVLVVGSDIENIAKEISNYQSVSKVISLDNKSFEHAIAEKIDPVIVSIAEKYSHIFAPATTFGKNVMPRVAVKLDVAQISDVINIESEDTFIRPIYAGNALATVKSNDAKKVITVRPTSFDVVAKEGGSGIVETINFESSDTFTEFLDREESKSDRPELSTARIVVSGGRGLQSADNFKLISDIADKLNAAIGASRAAVDAGYVSNDYQVGQTGKVVVPDLYIAVGISGAIQHLAGMKESKIIVAINKDGEAPIFSVADYGLEADLFEALPQFLEELNKLNTIQK